MIKFTLAAHITALILGLIATDHLGNKAKQGLWGIAQLAGGLLLAPYTLGYFLAGFREPISSFAYALYAPIELANQRGVSYEIAFQLVVQEGVYFWYVPVSFGVGGVLGVLFGLCGVEPFDLTPDKDLESKADDLEQKKLEDHTQRFEFDGPSWWSAWFESEPEQALAIGRDEDGNRVSVPLENLNSGCAIFGTNGSGKTNTTQVLMEEAAKRELPIVFVDCKPDPELRSWMAQLADEFGRDFQYFSLQPEEESNSYNPLENGRTTSARVDKILDLFRYEGEARFHKTQAQNALSLIIGALEESPAHRVDIPTIHQCTDLQVLDEDVIEAIEDEGIQEQYWNRLDEIEDEQGQRPGVRNELARFAHAEFADKLVSEPGSIDLVKSFQENGPVTLFKVSGIELGSTAELVGRMVLRDVKTALNDLVRRGKDDDVDPGLLRLLIIDEYHKIASEAAGSLLAMGRGYGLCSVLSTQQPTDVGEGPLFNRVMGNTNVKIAHRLVNKDDREVLANELGTETGREMTHKAVEEPDGDSQRDIPVEGSFRMSEEYRYHPKLFNRLERGEAIVSWGNNDPDSENSWSGGVKVRKAREFNP